MRACCAARTRARGCARSTRRRPRRCPACAASSIASTRRRRRSAARRRSSAKRSASSATRSPRSRRMTRETAVRALGLIEVDYELLPHVTDLEEAIADGAPKLEDGGNVFEAGSLKRGDARSAFKDADAVVEGTYRTSTQMHNSLESHGAVAAWDGENLTVWESTQHVFGVREGLRAALLPPALRIRVICDYMGGGFGSKGRRGEVLDHRVAASRNSSAVPVRCVLDRHEENLAAGNRSATLQKVKLGGKDGRITAVEHISWSNAGQGKWVGESRPDRRTRCTTSPNLTTKSYRVVTNAGSLAAFRAPGYVEGTFALEGAIDELAEQHGRRSAHAAPPSRRVAEGPAHDEGVLAEAPARVLHDRRARDRLEQAPRGRHARLGAASQARHRHGDADLGRRRRTARVRDGALQRRRHGRSCARGRRTSAPARAPCSRRSARRGARRGARPHLACASATPRARTVRSPPARSRSRRSGPRCARRARRARAVPRRRRRRARGAQDRAPAWSAVAS